MNQLRLVGAFEERRLFHSVPGIWVGAGLEQHIYYLVGLASVVETPDRQVKQGHNPNFLVHIEFKAQHLFEELGVPGARSIDK